MVNNITILELKFWSGANGPEKTEKRPRIFCIAEAKAFWKND